MTSLKNHMRLKCNYLLNLYTDCSTHPLKPNYTSLNSGKNYIKYSGLKMNLLRKVDMRRHQCEGCKKSFKCKLMKDFHKQLHHQPPAVEVDLFRLGKYFV